MKKVIKKNPGQLKRKKKQNNKARCMLTPPKANAMNLKVKSKLPLEGNYATGGLFSGCGKNS